MRKVLHLYSCCKKGPFVVLNPGLIIKIPGFLSVAAPNKAPFSRKILGTKIKIRRIHFLNSEKSYINWGDIE